MFWIEGLSSLVCFSGQPVGKWEQKFSKNSVPYSQEPTSLVVVTLLTAGWWYSALLFIIFFLKASLSLIVKSNCYMTKEGLT